MLHRAAGAHVLRHSLCTALRATLRHHSDLAGVCVDECAELVHVKVTKVIEGHSLLVYCP